MSGGARKNINGLGVVWSVGYRVVQPIAELIGLEGRFLLRRAVFYGTIRTLALQRDAGGYHGRCHRFDR